MLAKIGRSTRKDRDRIVSIFELYSWYSRVEVLNSHVPICSRSQFLYFFAFRLR